VLGRRLNLLFICGRAKWRSPTAEHLFSRDPRYSCRARGLSAKAQRRLAAADLEWADVIFVMERKHLARLREQHRVGLQGTPVHVLDIPDHYEFMSPALVDLLKEGVIRYLENAGG